MRKSVVILLFVSLILFGCEEEENWVEIENQAIYTEVLEFMFEYKEGWEQSLASQSFSIMENFFVPNSHIYHMERRQHQQLTGGRQVEKLIEASDIKIEENEYDEYRLSWKENVEIDQIGNVISELRWREYHISEGRYGYRITAIKRLTEKE